MQKNTILTTNGQAAVKNGSPPPAIDADPAAEERIVGAVFQDPAVLEGLGVTPQDLWDCRLRSILSAATAVDRSLRPDAFALEVADTLAKRGAMAEGDFMDVVGRCQGASSPLKLRADVSRVRKLSERRRSLIRLEEAASAIRSGRSPADPDIAAVVEAAARSIGTPAIAPPSDEDLGLVRASSIRPRRIEWHWRYRIPAGKMTLLAGDGGLGKSQTMLWMASRYTTGGPWPAGEGHAPLGDVVVLSAEDEPSDTIVPRLLAAGADLNRVDIHSATVTIRGSGKDPVVHPISLQDLDLWKQVFDRRPGCKLFIVDPLPSFLGRGVNDSKNGEFRAALEPFISQVIAPRQIAMLVNTHLNKGLDSKTPTHRVLGSVAYVNLARSVYFVLPDPEIPGRRYLMPDRKNNHAPDSHPGLSFTITGAEVANPDDPSSPIETSVPIFDDAPVTIDVRDLMSPKRERDAEPNQLDLAAEWLRARLETAGPSGSLLCSWQGDRAIGRASEWDWNARKLDSPAPEIREERSKAIHIRMKWWRERVLKGRLDGRASRHNDRWFFRLRGQDEWPSTEAIAAAEAATREALGEPPPDTDPPHTLKVF